MLEPTKTTEEVVELPKPSAAPTEPQSSSFALPSSLVCEVEEEEFAVNLRLPERPLPARLGPSKGSPSEIQREEKSDHKRKHHHNKKSTSSTEAKGLVTRTAQLSGTFFFLSFSRVTCYQLAFDAPSFWRLRISFFELISANLAKGKTKLEEEKADGEKRKGKSREQLQKEREKRQEDRNKKHRKAKKAAAKAAKGTYSSNIEAKIL